LLRHDGVEQIDFRAQIGLRRDNFAHGKSPQPLHYDDNIVFRLAQEL
jgi:hypothetical protein